MTIRMIQYVALTALFMVVSCGDEIKESPPKTSSVSAKDLEGTWIVDAESLKKLDEYINASEEEQRKMRAQITDLGMNMTFSRGLLLMTFSVPRGPAHKIRQTIEGAYQVVQSNGQAFQLQVDFFGDKELVEIDLTGDTLIYKKDGQTMSARRR